MAVWGCSLMAASNESEYFEIEIETGNESFARLSNADVVTRDEEEFLWAALERLLSRKRSNFVLLKRSSSESDGRGGGEEKTETIDVRKLYRFSRQALVLKNAFATNEQDNFKLDRMMAVGLTPSTQMAVVISSSFYSLWNLLSGFLGGFGITIFAQWRGHYAVS